MDQVVKNEIVLNDRHKKTVSMAYGFFMSYQRFFSNDFDLANQLCFYKGAITSANNSCDPTALGNRHQP